MGGKNGHHFGQRQKSDPSEVVEMVHANLTSVHICVDECSQTLWTKNVQSLPPLLPAVSTQELTNSLGTLCERNALQTYLVAPGDKLLVV